jgi:hypothetical protein
MCAGCLCLGVGAVRRPTFLREQSGSSTTVDVVTLATRLAQQRGPATPESRGQRSNVRVGWTGMSRPSSLL